MHLSVWFCRTNNNYFTNMCCHNQFWSEWE